MTEILSIRIDSKTKERLALLSKSSKRSKSLLVAEAIEQYLATEEWQLSEIHRGIKDLNSGNSVEHVKVEEWLASWGKKSKVRAPVRK